MSKTIKEALERTDADDPVSLANLHKVLSRAGYGGSPQYFMPMTLCERLVAVDQPTFSQFFTLQPDWFGGFEGLNVYFGVIFEEAQGTASVCLERNQIGDSLPSSFLLQPSYPEVIAVETSLSQKDLEYNSSYGGSHLYRVRLDRESLPPGQTQGFASISRAWIRVSSEDI